MLIVFLLPILYGVVNGQYHQLSKTVSLGLCYNHNLSSSHLKFHHSLNSVHSQALLLPPVSVLHLLNTFILQFVFHLFQYLFLQVERFALIILILHNYLFVTLFQSFFKIKLVYSLNGRVDCSHDIERILTLLKHDVICFNRSKDCDKSPLVKLPIH